MSIKFLCGLPGNGKSLLATRWIVEELVYGRRCVITNVSLKREELAVYIAREHPSAEVDLHTRLVILDEEATSRFWLTRGVGLRLENVTPAEEKEGKRLDFTRVHIPTPEYADELRGRGLRVAGTIEPPTTTVSAYDLGGVLYVIDEIHIYFDSRQWQTTGQSALFYLSQHRKLGDDVVCITQSLENVEKRFRKLAQDFTYVKYLKKLKFGMGLFSPPPVFVRSVYTSPPGPNAHAMETRTFSLDVSGIASCYDTAAGVGVLGNRADTQEKPKGLNYKWFIFVIIGFIGCLYFVPNVFSALVGFGMDRVMLTGSGGASATHSPTSSPPRTAAAPLASNREPAIIVTTTERAINTSEETFITALVGGAGLGRIGLSDGRWLKANDPLMQQIAENHIVYDGVRYEWQKPTQQGRGPQSTFNRTYSGRGPEVPKHARITWK